ncbi:MAG: hypothetical protein SGJ27_09055 [Candidatus Melainabacteria bacterium]|nr:hypothetical protein [Candidatus Melainabacteria bacterium]
MRAIAAFFMGSWGLILGLFFAGFFVATGHPVKPLDHALWGGYALLFSSICCVGMGRFIGDIKFGKTLAIIAGAAIILVFSLRVMGILPVA